MARQDAGAGGDFDHWLESQLDRELGPLCQATPRRALAAHRRQRSRLSLRLALAAGVVGLAIGGGSAAIQLTTSHSSGSGHANVANPAASTRHAEPAGTAKAATARPAPAGGARAATVPSETPEASDESGGLDRDDTAGAPSASAVICPPGQAERPCAVPGPSDGDGQGQGQGVGRGQGQGQGQGRGNGGGPGGNPGGGSTGD